MKLESQVVSLELSKELKENGFVQEGLFWWVKCYKDTILERFELFVETPYHLVSHTSEKLKGNELVWGERSSVYMYKEKMQEEEYFVAPTVAELGERLSKCGDRVFATWKATDNKWYCFDINERDIKQPANTEAECRAKMWLYLKKEGLL